MTMHTASNNVASPSVKQEKESNGIEETNIFGGSSTIENCVDLSHHNNDNGEYPKMNNPSSSLLKILYLLDTYQKYHILGKEKYQSYHWNKTKYVQRQSGGALLLNTNNHEMYSTQLLSIHKQITMNGDDDDDGKEQQQNHKQINNNSCDISASRFTIQVITNSNVPCHQQSRCEQQPQNQDRSQDSDHTSSYIRYRLVDQQRHDVKDGSISIENDNNATDEKENEQTCDLIDEVDDRYNDTSPPYETNASTFGLRQRRGGGTSKNTNNDDEFRSVNEKMKSITTSTTSIHNKKDVDKETKTRIISSADHDVVAKCDNADASTSICSTTFMEKKKKDTYMELAQKDMIRSLRYYIHAATLVASIQQEINNKNSAIG